MSEDLVTVREVSVLSVACAGVVPLFVLVVMILNQNYMAAGACVVVCFWLGCAAVAATWADVQETLRLEQNRRTQVVPFEASMLDEEQGGAALRVHFEKTCPRQVWVDEEGGTLEEGSAVVEADATCVVCLERVATGQEFRVLGCKHIFHQPCIDEWWSSTVDCRMHCPLCRQKSGHPFEAAEEEEQLAVADV